jgi:hypothetical protein
MSNREVSLGRLFVQEAVRAGTWGLIFLLVMGMFVTSLKKDIKRGIAFGVDRFVSKVVMTATDPALVVKTKRLVKNGIDYSIGKAAKKTKGILGALPSPPKESLPEEKEEGGERPERT